MPTPSADLPYAAPALMNLAVSEIVGQPILSGSAFLATEPDAARHDPNQVSGRSLGTSWFRAEKEAMKHIVVLGAGIGGMSYAYELRATLGARHKITVINEQPKFSFTPSNPGVAIGWRKPVGVQVDVSPALARHGIDLLPETVVAIRPVEKCVVTEVGTASTTTIS